LNIWYWILIPSSLALFSFSLSLHTVLVDVICREQGFHLQPQIIFSFSFVLQIREPFAETYRTVWECAKGARECGEQEEGCEDDGIDIGFGDRG
jgi:hypothetical protein